MVDMGVGKQDEGWRETVFLDVLGKLGLLIRGLRGGVDDGALLRGLVDHDIAVHPEVIKSKTLDHNSQWSLMEVIEFNGRNGV